MAYRLPPLNSLRLFEAAGRHLSFKAAAEELNLTPSAISHGVLTLEAWLGVDLFLRGNRTLTLTAAGAAYLPQVRAALEMIVGASNAVPGRKPTGRLAVSVSPTFGVRWLLPRLVRFSDRHPDIEVSVDTNHRLVEFPRDGIDVAIRMGRGDWPGLDATCLVRESLVPVCAPRLAAKIRSADDLGGKVLLHVVDAREDWVAWSKLAGGRPSRRQSEDRVSTPSRWRWKRRRRDWASPWDACHWSKPNSPPASSSRCSVRQGFVRQGIGW